MYKLDIFNNPEPLSIYLVKVDGTVLGCLDTIIDTSNVSLTIGINQQFELSFSVTSCEGMTNWYDYLHEGMYLLVEKVGLFKMNQPSITNDGVKEIKSIKAYSCESELEDKMTTVSINMGTEESMEYNVEYDDKETEPLTNPHTSLPYDWIVLYNTFPEQLTAIKTKYLDGYYGIVSGNGTCLCTNTEKMNELLNIIKLIPRIKNSVSYVDNEDGSKDSVITEYIEIRRSGAENTISSIMILPGFSDRVDQLVIFYTKYRKQLSLLSIVLEEAGGWDVGNIYGVSDGDYSLANSKYQFEIDESVYSFLTKTLSMSLNCVVGFDTIQRKVNVTPIEHLGSDTGIVIGYDTLVNTLDISTDDERLTTRLKVSGGEGLGIGEINFSSEYIADIDYKINARGSDGERIYVSDSIAEQYNDYVTFVENKRNELIAYRRQYDSTKNKIDELNNRVPSDSLKTDWGTFTEDELKASLTTYKNLLETLKSLYRDDYGSAGFNNNDEVNEDYIKNTEYWWDYIAYKNTIVEIQCAIAVFPYYSDHTQWTAQQISDYEERITAWETIWSLYGVSELRSKIASYKYTLDVLLEESVIRSSQNSYSIKQWSNLSDAEKSMYGMDESSYKYDTYMDSYSKMISAQTYLEDLLTELSSLEDTVATIEESMSNIIKATILENFFTPNICMVIRRLYRDSTYENHNILTTSIDTTDERIDRMVELLDDAKEQLSIYSRPQLTFSVDADNLLSVGTFKPLWESFVPGNYMLVQYKDDTYVRLRMIAYTFNPCKPSTSGLGIVFSNFTRSRAYYRDWGSILGSASSVTGGSSYSGNGTVSANGVDTTISDTMLSKLLKTERFEERVKDVITDTITANTINAKSAKFEGLANGTTTIDGGCIQTGVIKSENYNGTLDGIDNTVGSILRLDDGAFNFGGGKLLFDGTDLVIKGNIESYGGKIAGWNINDISIYKDIRNLEALIPYEITTMADSDKCRFVSYVKTMNENSQNKIHTASIGQTTIGSINQGTLPRISVETTSQLRDASGNPLSLDGYNLTGDEFYRLHLDFVNSSITYVFTEYESILSGVTTINKEYNWRAYYLFNEGANVKIGTGKTLTINDGNISIGSGVTVPTMTSGDNSLHVANTAYVKSEAESIFNAKIKFIDVDAPVQTVTISGGDVTTVSLDLSSNVPTGYKIRCVFWRSASYYGYFAPAALYPDTNTSVSARVRNLDTANKDLSVIRLTLLCIPTT